MKNYAMPFDIEREISRATAAYKAAHGIEPAACAYCGNLADLTHARVRPDEIKCGTCCEAETGEGEPMRADPYGPLDGVEP